MSAGEATHGGLSEALELFNAARYLEAHEAFEELWEATHGERADLYKGLLQAAIALHHYREGNLAGARKLYSGHRRYLAPYLPRYDGLDVEALLADMQAFLLPALRASGDTALPFDPERRPRIRSSASETDTGPERPS